VPFIILTVLPARCRSCGKSPEQVVAFLNEGAFDMARFKEEGLVTDLKWVFGRHARRRGNDGWAFADGCWHLWAAVCSVAA
jgi:hypothetical protein